jgi:hypothetical protein
MRCFGGLAQTRTDMLAAPAKFQIKAVGILDPVLLTGQWVELGDRLTGQRVKLGSSSNRLTSLRVELGRRLGLEGLHGHALLNRLGLLRGLGLWVLWVQLGRSTDPDQYASRVARLSRCGAETDGLRSLSAAIPNRLFCGHACAPFEAHTTARELMCRVIPAGTLVAHGCLPP